jgi:CHRD domain-containing protein
MRFRFKVAAVVAVSGLATAGIATVALANNSGRFDTNLTGYEEIATLSTSGTGFLSARLSGDGDEIAYTLSYEGPFNANPAGGTVTQAHIHLGAPAFNGGISAFLCTNLGNGPVGTPPCPASGTVRGVITAPQVVGPSAQGISAGEFAELVRALRAGAAYANVHTTTFPAGEIRGQISDNDKND